MAILVKAMIIMPCMDIQGRFMGFSDFSSFLFLGLFDITCFNNRIKMRGAGELIILMPTPS